MSTSLRCSVFVFVLALNLLAKSPEKKSDLIAAEKATLARLAGSADLTVNKWLAFVDTIDNQCSNADEKASPAKQDQLCSFYYELYKIAELFSETQPNGPTWEQCMRAGVTSDSLSITDSVKNHVNTIADKLCPKE